MRKSAATLSAIMVASLIGMTGAGAAQAATTSGNLYCGIYTGQLTSSTTGLTRHNWTNSSSGDVKVYTWTTGGPHTSAIYTSSSWILYAATSIDSKSTTCV